MKKLLLIITLFLGLMLGFGQASLPVSTTTLSKDALPTGFSQTGLGADYTGPKLKFDSNGDELILFFNNVPGTLTFDIGINNNFNGSLTFPIGYEFKVEESSDGVNYSNLASYIAGDMRGTKTLNGINNATRYIRWVYTQKPSGKNTALWNINLSTAFAKDSKAIAPTSPSQVIGSTISSLADTPAEAVDVFAFEIVDSGLGDTLPTDVTNIRLKLASNNTADWVDFIQGVLVRDAQSNISVSVASVTITNSYIDISFNSGDLTISDNDSKVLMFSVYLNTSNIMDNKILAFMVEAQNNGFTADASGSIFADPFPNGDIVSNDFMVDVEATEMQFKQQPTDVVVNTIMNLAVTVAYTDENGNVDRYFDGFGVTATLSASGSTLDGSTTIGGTPVNGLMTFSDIKFTQTNSEVSLTVLDTSGLITNQTVTSNFFDVLFPGCNITNDILINKQIFDIPLDPNSLPTTLSANVTSSSGNGQFPNTPMYTSPNEGVKVTGANGKITFGPIDTSKYENVSFSIRLASFSTSATGGADQGDFVRIRVKNGSSPYSNELVVKGKSNGNNRWSFTSGTGVAQVSYDGDNSEVVFQPTTNGDVTTEGYSTLKVTNLPITTNLKIRIHINNTNTNEIWVLDDAILRGDQKDYTVWNNSIQTWSNGVPDDTKKAFFDTSYNTNLGNVTACECEIKAGKTVTVTANKYLKITNNIINNGHLRIKNKASLVQLNSNVTITGSNYVVKKSTTPYKMYDYTYWSSPVENADINTVFANSPQDRMYWFNTANFDDTDNDSFDDNNDDWTLASGAMTVGKGYIVMGEGAQFPVPNPIPTTTQIQAVTFTGKINNGTISVPVQADANTTDAYTNQNLIGNPYPSAISAPLFIDQNSNIDGTLYFWTHNDQISSTFSGPDAYNFTNDSYVTYVSGTGGVLGNCSGCTLPTDYIASGQGFFVDVNDPSVDVVFKNNMRVTDNNDNFYRNTNSTEKNRIWLNMTTNTNEFRQILVGFFDEATNNDDRDYDGKRLENGNNFDFYSLINDSKYAVQGVPTLQDNKTIPIGVEIPVDSQINISIDRFEGDLDQVNIYLRDYNLSILHDLKQGDYTVNMMQGDYKNRFELVFSRNTLNTDSTILNNSSDLIVTNQENQILVKLINKGKMKNIQVFDVIGRLISNSAVDTNEFNLTGNYKSGSVYFVKVKLENGQVITKKMIKL